jgi:hypothetical protein
MHVFLVVTIIFTFGYDRDDFDTIVPGSHGTGRILNHILIYAFT